MRGGPGDKIVLRGIRLFGRHGVLPEEKTLGQRFVVNISIGTCSKKAGESDRLEDTVNYANVFRIAKDIVQGPSRNLIEKVAEEIAESVLHEERTAGDIIVEVKKPHVALPGELDYAGVEIYRRRD